MTMSKWRAVRSDKVGIGQYADGRRWTWSVLSEPEGEYKAARDAVEPDSSSWEYGLYAYTVTDKEPEHLFDTGPETVVIVSSDLSHYLPYEDAQAMDSGTVSEMLRLDGPLEHDQACGATPANGLLLCARRREMRARLLGMCNSGDTAGYRRRVVGYAAVAFLEHDAS